MYFSVLILILLASASIYCYIESVMVGIFRPFLVLEVMPSLQS